jgi:peptide/nickel transport system substrate-binding protein
MRPIAATLLGALMASTASVALAADPKPGGAINVATVGEPPTLDPMESPADVVGIISQHMFETLYTWGEGWRVVPLLAAKDAEIAAGGKTYTIPLRTGVKFHDGTDMTSEDVKASLERWMTVAQRGKQTAEKVESVTAPDESTIVITLKEPFAPLLPLLALQTSAAIILPAEKQAQPMTEYVGTGPYKFRERKPDQYVQLVKFDEYVPREDPTNMYGGRRVPYLDEIRFVPVPNASTRIEGALSGLYNYADALPVESLPRLQGQAQVAPLVLEPFGWPFMFFNAKEGALTDPALRRAVLASLNFEDMMLAAFGSTDFYEATGAWYPEGTAFHTDAGSEAYSEGGDPDAARELAEEAGYDGQPVRILVSKQYDFHYKLAQVAAEYMRAAGFEVDLQVLDWATLLQRRNDPAVWDIFYTHGPILPEPTLYSFFNSAAPGWWDTPAKAEALAAFNAEPDPTKRAEKWADMQTLIYEEVPVLRVGNFNALGVHSSSLEGVQPAVWPFFWNVSLKQ